MDRIRTILEDILKGEAGFKRRRSTVEQMITVRQVVEQGWEYARL